MISPLLSRGLRGPWYAIVLAAVPVCFLYVHNLDQTPLRDVVAPLALALLVSAATLAILRIVLRDDAVAGVVTATLIAVFFGYGPAIQMVRDVTGVFIRPRWGLPVAALVVAFATLAARQHRRACHAAIRPLNVFAATLFVILAANASVAALRLSNAWNLDDERFPHSWVDGTVRPMGGDRHNVYYIILDGYARNDVLALLYAFDNSEFTTQLEARGFVVNPESRANYATTWLSLASSLNGTHLTALSTSARGDDRGPSYAMIRDNRASRFLRGRGYAVVNIASGWGPTNRLAVADENLSCAATSEFVDVLLRQTAAWPFAASPANPHAARLCQFRLLAGAWRGTEPRFVFAHILLPHPPYVFGPNGEQRTGHSALGDESTWGDRQGYVGQLRFVNAAVLGVLDTILANDHTDPILILQSDHGTASSSGWAELSAAFARERMPILSALRVPDPAGLNAARFVTPVNTFGMLFERYFGARAVPLPDASYLSVDPAYYRFRRVDSALIDGAP